MSGSNFSVTPNVNVAFNCDDKNVTADFYTNDEPAGRVALGRRLFGLRVLGKGLGRFWRV
jgi:hypothetical protein